MREGWKCPACKRINSPDLDACPCSGGGTAVTPATPIYPGTSGGTVGITPSWRMTSGGTTAGTAWEGVTFTATNAA